jgi:hypothetical protein
MMLKKHVEWMSTAQGENHKRLFSILTRIDGDFVVWQGDPDIEAVLTGGEKWSGPRIRLVPGEPHACHYNVATLWRLATIDTIVTGYAMTADEDGIKTWRQHSWGIASGRIVETTQRRSIYYGVRLVGAAADEFADKELG